MLATLGGVCRDARVAAGARQIDIATRIRRSHSVVSDFENAKGWPQAVERLVVAYAAETGIPAGELWRRAVERAFG